MNSDPNQDELIFLKKFAKDSCGLVIPEEKNYLFTYRLGPVIESHKFSSFQELIEKLKVGNKDLREEVITELTTHETFFFRDKHPFHTFRNILLPWLEKSIIERKKRSYIRKGPKASLWSAACSTGQEPYSLAMLIHEYARTSSIDASDISVLATDVSSDVLSRTMRAIYKKFEVERGLNGDFNESFRHKFFKPVGDDFQVVDEVKKIVNFKYCNLMDPLEHLGGFDIIFCRNVLIYFDDESKEKIIKQFHHMLSPNGYLMLGASENIHWASSIFKAVQEGESLVYTKV